MKSFEKIYEQNYPMMYRVAVKMIGDKDAVRDIVQEVFVCLYEKGKGTDEINNYSAWLYKATYFKSIDYLKANKRFSKLETIEDRTCQEESYEQKEVKKMIQNALNKLDPKNRFLVVLYSEGLSYKEMAEITEINFASVGKTLSRALKKMEKELKTEYYELF
ncbi:RNA polymerase sigma factor [Maribellus maritimus]|uniref:RNA polymerase sigma factor n=1 Tax=Maribellus maritimus TaxID=2870838 RepID=UPI001EE9D16E|nr:sigma-70 family RNA polymerase sigma factor [Maribellus maritimus]MCG6189345.1 sigma-70 family RNA polymerase sigma factor [Maribellus maritimus]